LDSNSKLAEQNTNNISLDEKAKKRKERKEKREKLKKEAESKNNDIQNNEDEDVFRNVNDDNLVFEDNLL